MSYHLNVNNIRSYKDTSQSEEVFELRIIYIILYYSYITNSTLKESIIDISNNKEYICNTAYTLNDYDKLDTLVYLIIVLYYSSADPSFFNDSVIKKYVFQQISTTDLINKLQTEYKYELDHLYKKHIISSHYLGQKI